MYFFIRKLSIDSGFKVNDILRRIYREKFKPAQHLDSEGAYALGNLKKLGFAIFNPTEKSTNFSKDLLENLMKYPVMREKDGMIGSLESMKSQSMPGSFRYYYMEQDLPIKETLDMLEIMGVMSIVRHYLGNPILRCMNAWHSNAISEFTSADEIAAAQYYHNDNDIPSGWLKVFIYLTNVGMEQGPHVYVPKSHLSLPNILKRDGRFEDEEVHGVFGEGVRIIGDAGSVIIADTQGMHKGLTVQDGCRTILQLEFTNSLFGAETPKHKNASFALNELKNYDERFKLRYVRDAN
jgi:hypothetical protein